MDVSHDAEVREALGENNLFFEQAITIGENEVLVTGKLESRGWIVDTESENEKLNLSFRLGRSLSRDEAIGQAAAYIESKAGRRFKNLTDNELRMLATLDERSHRRVGPKILIDRPATEPHPLLHQIFPVGWPSRRRAGRVL